MMAPTFLHGAMLGAATLGFLSLALGMEDHAEQILGRVPPRVIRRLARLAGWLGLTAALAIGVWGFGWGMGPVWTLGWASVAALSVVFGLAKWKSRNRLARPAAARPGRAG